MKSLKKLSQKFMEFENKHNLMDFEVDNIYIWQIVRMYIFMELQKKILNTEESHYNISYKEKIKYTPNIIYNSVINNPFFYKKTVDKVIFPHERIKKFENDYIDIYTYFLYKNFITTRENILILEKPYNLKHFTKKRIDIEYLDSVIIYSKMLKFFIKSSIHSKYLFIKKIEDDFKVYFNIDFDLYSLFNEKLKKHKSYYMLYKKLLKKLSPKEIYLTVSYGNMDIVHAAKDLNIKVIELQHGVFSKYHLGYYYNHLEKVKYFPNEFWVWNEYWKNLIDLPIDKSYIKIYPFKYQEIEINKYKNVKKNENQVIVFSQGILTNKIAYKILKNFDLFKDKIIKYKLHPGEYYNYKDNENLQLLLKKDNVELIKDCDLYKLIATSEYQVGVFSTALYEGLEFDLKTILIDLPGIEYMEELIESNKIYKII